MSTNWKSQNWDSLISGESCPVCKQIRWDEKEDEHFLYIRDLPCSRLYLAKNQFVKGYCILICHRHVIELHELSEKERAGYFDDVAFAAKALQIVFQADKMNYNILGNLIPHLHAHILPRYFTDTAPNRPIDPGSEKVYLTQSEYEERIKLILDQIQSMQN
jgi:diadenosine tetraphosphate (Ap4A) HIT family hydrolase